MALKPLPKLIIIFSIVGAVGFGLSKGIPLLKQYKQQETATEVQPELVQPPVSVQQPVQMEVQQQSVQIQQPTVQNGGKGLDALLKAGTAK